MRGDAEDGNKRTFRGIGHQLAHLFCHPADGLGVNILDLIESGTEVEGKKATVRKQHGNAMRKGE